MTKRHISRQYWTASDITLVKLGAKALGCSEAEFARTSVRVYVAQLQKLGLIEQLPRTE